MDVCEYQGLVLKYKVYSSVLLFTVNHVVAESDFVIYAKIPFKVCAGLLRSHSPSVTVVEGSLNKSNVVLLDRLDNNGR
jgi:hypothetical protein